MSARARTPDEVTDLFNQHVRGHVVRQFTVYGINALKSMDPGPADLEGERIEAIEFTSECTFWLRATAVALEVDLQRVGSLSWVPDGAPWKIGQPSMPTGQLLLDTPGAVNFTEPSKTKRITFRLHRG